MEDKVHQSVLGVESTVKPIKWKKAEDYRVALLEERDKAHREYIARVLAKHKIQDLVLDERLAPLPIPPRP